jgi:hypothetical protein
MERLNCFKCNQPTLHQTVDFSNQSIHGGPKCLTCGTVVLPAHVAAAIEESLTELNVLEHKLICGG